MANVEAQELIDAQLVDLEPRCTDLQRQIHELKTRRNTYAPISKLPDDVLLEIFALTQIIYPDSQWYREVTHICRRWRDIAIDAPTLWTNPPLLLHHFSILMLERSKSADLTIYMEYGTQYRTIKKVLECIGRIEKLELSLEMDLLDNTRNLLASCRQPASRLRRLLLHCLSDDISWDSRLLFSLSTFCQLHLLRELEITNVIFDWNILPLLNLKDLKIYDISSPSRISIQKLLDSLRQMPDLRRLHIPLSQALLLAPSATEICSVARVKLPRLTHLELRDSNMGYVQWFLRKTTLPRLHRMMLSPPPRTAINTLDRDTSQIAQIFASSVVGGNFGTFDSLDLYSTHFHLNMTDQRDFDADDMDWEDERPHVHFQMREDLNAGRLFVQTSVDILLLCHANLSCLVELKLEELSMTQDELFRLSTVLCSVQKIEIFRSSITSLAFINVLAMLPANHPSEVNKYIPFPSLKVVEFSVIDFAADALMFEALRDSLMLRYEYGVAIPRLELFECWISSRQFALLKEIVVKVRYSTTMR